MEMEMAMEMECRHKCQLQFGLQLKEAAAAQLTDHRGNSFICRYIDIQICRLADSFAGHKMNDSAAARLADKILNEKVRQATTFFSFQPKENF